MLGPPLGWVNFYTHSMDMYPKNTTCKAYRTDFKPCHSQCLAPAGQNLTCCSYKKEELLMQDSQCHPKGLTRGWSRRIIQRPPVPLTLWCGCRFRPTGYGLPRGEGRCAPTDFQRQCRAAVRPGQPARPLPPLLHTVEKQLERKE